MMPPRNADLIVAFKERLDSAELERLRYQFREQFSGHRALFINGGDVTITPIARRARGKYMPSLVGHVKK